MGLPSLQISGQVATPSRNVTNFTRSCCFYIFFAKIGLTIVLQPSWTEFPAHRPCHHDLLSEHFFVLLTLVSFFVSTPLVCQAAMAGLNIAKDTFTLHFGRSV